MPYAPRSALLQRSASDYATKVDWSNDGSQLLCLGEDASVGVMGWSASGWEQATVAREPEVVYDTAWYPMMCSAEPATCGFLTTARSQPVHLWDSMHGRQRATYRCEIHEELCCAISVAFDNDGASIWAGSKNGVHIFDTGRPGNDATYIDVTSGMHGIVSSIAFPVHSAIMAALGSFSGSVGIYDRRILKYASQTLSHPMGVSCLRYGQDPYTLFVGCRKSDAIYAWDLRQIQEPVAMFPRPGRTNQRLYFDVNQNVLVTGGLHGSVMTYRLDTKELVRTATVTQGTTNAIAMHDDDVAISCGSRCFGEDQDTSDYYDIHIQPLAMILGQV